MEEQIKQVVKKLKTSYLLFWIVTIFLFVLGEMDILPVGIFADDIKVRYYFETVGILLTAICIPLSLKLFSLVLKHKINQLSFPVALNRYALWSMVRQGLLLAVIVCNLLCYYMTMSSTGALCALCALTASFFCLPGEKRLRQELHISKEE